MDKVKKKLGEDTVKEMEAMGVDTLKQTIVSANETMSEVKEELEANPAYQEAKANYDVFKSGQREVNTRQKAKIAFALYLLSAGSDGTRK